MNFDHADFSYSRQRGGRAPETVQARHFVVRVCGQVIGLPVDAVKTVFRIERLTPVPLAPREIAGLANLRGRIVTVIHVDRCLWLDRGEEPVSTLAAGVEINGEDYALLIDDSGDVGVSGEDNRIASPPHIDPRISVLMSACYRMDDGFLSILDPEALLRRISRSGETGAFDGASPNSKTGAKQ